MGGGAPGMEPWKPIDNWLRQPLATQNPLVIGALGLGRTPPYPLHCCCSPLHASQQRHALESIGIRYRECKYAILPDRQISEIM